MIVGATHFGQPRKDMRDSWALARLAPAGGSALKGMGDVKADGDNASVQWPGTLGRHQKFHRRFVLLTPGVGVGLGHVMRGRNCQDARNSHQRDPLTPP